MPIATGPGAASTPIQADWTPSQFARLFALTPDGAAEYLAGRERLTPTLDWRALWQEEHAQQFTVSRLARLDLLKAIQEGITQSVGGDLSRRDFTRDITQLLQKAGWWGKVEVVDPDTGEVLTTRFDPARVKLIYDMNTRMAHSAGRWERIQAAKGTHPYLRYITKDDDRVRPEHAAWHNLTLPVDHPFWLTHYPPNGWRCRCRVVAMSQAEYDKGKSPKGDPLKTVAPDSPPVGWLNKLTGEVEQVPNGIDPGFAYNVGVAGARQAELRRLADNKLGAAPPDLAAAAAAKGLREGGAAGAGAGGGDRGPGAPPPPFGQRPGLFDLPPVPVTTLTGLEFGERLTKVGLAKAADALLRRLQAGPGLTNDDQGWRLRINRKGRAKMGDNPDLSAVESQAVAAIEALMQRAVLAETHPDLEHRNPQVAAVHRFYVPMEIAGVLYRVKLTVKTFMPATGQGRVLHAISAVEIENAPLGTLPAHETPKASKPQAQPTTGREMSVTDLLAGAKRQDGELFAP